MHHNQYFFHYQCCESIKYLKCVFVQGPPGPGGLLGEVGKVGPHVSRVRVLLLCF